MFLFEVELKSLNQGEVLKYLATALIISFLSLSAVAEITSDNMTVEQANNEDYTRTFVRVVLLRKDYKNLDRLLADGLKINHRKGKSIASELIGRTGAHVYSKLPDPDCNFWDWDCDHEGKYKRFTQDDVIEVLDYLIGRGLNPHLYESSRKEYFILASTVRSGHAKIFSHLVDTYKVDHRKLNNGRLALPHWKRDWGTLNYSCEPKLLSEYFDRESNFYPSCEMGVLFSVSTSCWNEEGLKEFYSDRFGYNPHDCP